MATITLTGIDSDIKRHLSIIGKRLYDKEGKNLFSNITVSSNEDTIFTQYISAAAQNIAAALAHFVTSASNTSITVTGSRWNTNLTTALQEAGKSYAVLFTVGEYLAMSHPELADKYYRDAQTMLNTLVSIAYNKVAPTSSSSTYADVTGQIPTT